MYIILYILLILNPSSQQDNFHIRVSYYSKPIINLTWSISISRMGKEIYIDILDYKNKNIRKKISNERYIKLLNNLNKNGIWILNDHYRKDSPNGYYEVEIKKGIAHNSFKIEAGVPFSGNNSKFLEIIRSITNIAELVIYD